MNEELSQKYRRISAKKPNLNEISDIILILPRKVTTYHNCMTGEESPDYQTLKRPNRGTIFIKKDNRYHYGFGIEYDKEEDVLVIREYYFVSNSLKKGETRGWSQLDFCIIVNKELETYCSKYYFSNYFSKHIDIFGDSSKPIPEVAMMKRSKSIIDNFFNSTIPLKGFSATIIDSPYSLCYLIDCDKPAIVQKKQKEIDKLISLTLPSKELSDNVKKKIMNYTIKEYFHHNKTLSLDNIFGWQSNDCAIIQKVSDDICVIRVFLSYFDITKIEDGDEFDISKMTFSEYGRIYVTKEDVFICKKFVDKWLYVKKGLKSSNFKIIIAEWSEKDIEGTRMQYLVPFLQESDKALEHILSTEYENWLPYEDKEKVVGAAASIREMIECPLLESFNKSEYKNLVYFSKNHCGDMSPRETLKYLLGDIDFNQTSITKAANIPAFMLKEIDIRIGEIEKKDMRFSYDKIREERKIYRMIFFIKRMFKNNVPYLSRMNKDDFCWIIDEMTSFNAFNFDYYFSVFCSVINKLCVIFGVNNFKEYIRYFKEICLNDNSASWKERQSLITTNNYSDFVSMCYELKDRAHIDKWKYKNKEDFTYAHDAITDVYNSLKTELLEKENKEKMEKNRKRWNSYEYTGEKFSVIAVQKIEDIANEGIALRHCVKSYTNAVLNGYTDIMFIRRNEELDKPFFTLEIRNKAIRQCHGLANSNINTVVGLEDFLKEYCDKVKIKFTPGGEALCV